PTLLLSPPSTPFPYTTLFRSRQLTVVDRARPRSHRGCAARQQARRLDRAAQSLVLREPVDVAAADPRLRPLVHRGRGRRLSRHRSEEHTSELQSHLNLVCRLL